jgi:hypothetical protein
MSFFFFLLGSSFVSVDTSTCHIATLQQEFTVRAHDITQMMMMMMMMHVKEFSIDCEN